MPCFSPLTGYRSSEVNSETGKRGIVFRSSKALIEGSSLKLPCGQCIGCRLARGQAWAIRAKHEAGVHEHNCFLTLTYDDQSVPADYSVRVRDLQLFMKRLRDRNRGTPIRFFSCGEYGDQTLRPHYHALLFGFDFRDKKKWAKRAGFETFKSEALSELWPFGLHEIGSVSYQSSAYVARYVMKKVTGDRADDHYLRVSPVDGAMHRVAPEFATMSRRPGLGSDWFDRFGSDAFPSDFVVVDGRKVKPPTFYLRRLDEPAAEAVARTRKRFARQPEARANSTPERLAVREEVTRRRAAQLVRPVD